MPVVTTPRDEKEALELFPKVAGLARRVHDSSVLYEKFEKLVAAKLDGQKRTLTRRVPTRWNLDFDCLRSHVELEMPVKQLMSDIDNDLSRYELSASQWKLAKELTMVLEIFEHLTKLFSQAEVPLIYQVIPMLEALEHDLDKVQNEVELLSVIRLAAIAALQVVGKYYAHTDDNEVYRIAIVMSPDRKVEWFRRNEDWRTEDVMEVDRLVRQRWQETYAAKTSESAAMHAEKDQPQRVRKWAIASSYDNLESASASARFPSDSIEAYLESTPVSREDVLQAGGPLLYWEQAMKTRPKLARMALDFLSAPASSVEAERAFSAGHLQVGHLQHGTSSQTFKARVAVGSWAKEGLIWPKDLAGKILKDSTVKMDKSRKDIAMITVDSD